MEKRFSSRKAGVLLAGAVAAVGLTSFGTSQANAGLEIELRAYGASPGVVISPDGSTVTLPDTSSSAQVGINVIAHLTGTDGVQIVNNFDNQDKSGFPATYPLNDTRNNEAIQFLVGSFNTTGSIKGNYDAASSLPTGAFSGNGSHGAVALDFDGDGSIDLGYAPGTSTDPTNLWAARSNSPALATDFINSTHPSGTTGLSGLPTSPVDFTKTTGAIEQDNPVDQLIDANTSDVLIGQLLWTVTGGDGLSTLNFLVRTNGDAQALWYQDGSNAAKNSLANSAEYSTSPLTVAVPEPASLGLLALAGAGLIGRRRRKD